MAGMVTEAQVGTMRYVRARACVCRIYVCVCMRVQAFVHRVRTIDIMCIPCVDAVLQ